MVERWNIGYIMKFSKIHFTKLHEKNKQGFITYTKINKITFQNTSLETRQKAMNVKPAFHGFSYEHYLHSFLCRKHKQLIHPIGTEKGNQIIKYTIELGNSLGMAIVVEGVETEEQYTYLKTLGCDFVQDYYLSKPLPNEKLEELLTIKASTK